MAREIFFCPRRGLDGFEKLNGFSLIRLICSRYNYVDLTSLLE